MLNDLIQEHETAIVQLLLSRDAQNPMDSNEIETELELSEGSVIALLEREGSHLNRFVRYSRLESIHSPLCRLQLTPGGALDAAIWLESRIQQEATSLVAGGDQRIGFRT